MSITEREQELENRVLELEAEIKQLKQQQFFTEKPTVKAFPEVADVLALAEKAVGDYFSEMFVDPSKALIEIEGQRYVLMRASSLSVDFFNTILKLYADQGETEAIRIGQNFLFDIAHVIGMEDAANFHEKMKLDSFLEKLSAGPVHFAYSGWAYVEILPDSNPVPGEDFLLHYHHPYSFEADSWIQSGKKSEKPVCIMNAGYSSGWCEKSAGQELTSVEISCRACGDDNCTFIMAPPHRIDTYLQQYKQENRRVEHYDVPSFFIRKALDEKVRKAKEKAEASDRAKSEFLANMSHEIRTPLNTILGYTELLKKETVQENKQEFISYINESTQHLIRIVNDILDLSKIEAGQLLINPEAVNLRVLFYQLANDVKILAAERWQQLNFEFSISAEFPEYFICDKTRLQQIFYNLLSNAIKFTDSGLIKVSADIDSIGKLAVFSVQDQGIGIDPEKFDEIFEIFKQGDSSISRKYGGSGLGLSICKSLINLMGGSIKLKSEIGSGAAFVFNLPLEIPKNETSVQNEIKQSELNKKYRIIVAEDNALNMKLIELILKKEGHTAYLANDGFELIKIYNENPDADLIVTDLQMPVMSGIDAVKNLRAMGAELPIIALTAHALQEDREQAFDAGCNAYLTKPVSPRQLLEKIQELLNPGA